MKQILLLATCLLCPASSFAAGESGGPALPIDIAAPKEWKVSIQFMRSKVAAGAIDNPAHKSEFTVQVLDSKGAPLVGVDVPLPKVVKGGLGPNDEPTITAKLSWNAEYLADKQTVIAKTDKKGQAKGVFISGHRTETCEIQLMDAKASIPQVWNEREDRFDSHLENFGSPTLVGYTMSFKDGEEEISIMGHKISFAPTSIELLVNDPTDGPDEDADGKPDGKTSIVRVSNKTPEDPFWRAFLSASKWDYVVIEDKPGHYSGQYLAAVPERAIVDGLEIKEIQDAQWQILDNSAFESQ